MIGSLVAGSAPSCQNVEDIEMIRAGENFMPAAVDNLLTGVIVIGQYGTYIIQARLQMSEFERRFSAEPL